MFSVKSKTRTFNYLNIMNNFMSGDSIGKVFQQFVVFLGMLLISDQLESMQIFRLQTSNNFTEQGKKCKLNTCSYMFDSCCNFLIFQKNKTVNFQTFLARDTILI